MSSTQVPTDTNTLASTNWSNFVHLLTSLYVKTALPNLNSNNNINNTGQLFLHKAQLTITNAILVSKNIANNNAYQFFVTITFYDMLKQICMRQHINVTSQFKI